MIVTDLHIKLSAVWHINFELHHEIDCFLNGSCCSPVVAIVIVVVDVGGGGGDVVGPGLVGNFSHLAPVPWPYARTLVIQYSSELASAFVIWII